MASQWPRTDRHGGLDPARRALLKVRVSDSAATDQAIKTLMGRDVAPRFESNHCEVLKLALHRGAAPSAAAARDPSPLPAPPSRLGRDVAPEGFCACLSGASDVFA